MTLRFRRAAFALFVLNAAHQLLLPAHLDDGVFLGDFLIFVLA
jgi:hypothetical protein